MLYQIRSRHVRDSQVPVARRTDHATARLVGKMPAVGVLIQPSSRYDAPVIPVTAESRHCLALSVFHAPQLSVSVGLNFVESLLVPELSDDLC